MRDNGRLRQLSACSGLAPIPLEQKSLPMLAQPQRLVRSYSTLLQRKRAFSAQRWTRSVTALTTPYGLYATDQIAIIDAVRPQRLRAATYLVADSTGKFFLADFVSSEDTYPANFGSVHLSAQFVQTASRRRLQSRPHGA